MAIRAGLDTSELSSLAKDMYRTAEQVYPKETKAFLRKEGTKAKQEITRQTKSSTKKHTGNLLKGIKRTKVTKYNGDYQIRVINKAYHAHLLEYGHVEVDWGRRTEKYVPGKHMFDATVSSFSGQFAEDVEGFIDDMLAKGLEL